MSRIAPLLIPLAGIFFSISLSAQPGPIKNLRYEDDFSYLKQDSSAKKGLDRLKFMPLSKKNQELHLSLGGELRQWYELRRNPNFGDLPPGTVDDDNGTLQHRFMLHGDLNLSKRFRLFGQLNNTLEFNNPNPLIPEIIVDGLGVHQFFVDWRMGAESRESKSILRLGRQEYSFGNELLISSREGPNNRQPFDGATYIRNNENSQVNVLVATPIIINPEVFDNTHTEEALWGVYANLRKRKKAKLDLYYLGFYSERRQYNFVPGYTHRHTAGARLWKHDRYFYYDLETMYQSGQFNDLTINAMNFTGEARYVFQDAFLKPMIGLGVSYITGDLDPHDRQLNTFDPLYPKPVYGLATPQGPSNIAHVRPTFGFQPVERWFINLRWYWLARASNQDGTYSPGMTQVRPFPETSSESRRVGIQYALDMFYIVNKNLAFILFASYVEAGDYPKETGQGMDVYFLATSVQFKF